MFLTSCKDGVVYKEKANGETMVVCKAFKLLEDLERNMEKTI
jgi:hypothetical protein